MWGPKQESDLLYQGTLKPRRAPPAPRGRFRGRPKVVTAILWEFAEYLTFIRHSHELATAYTDTLGDLALV